MKKWIVLQKEIGETPLQALEAWKQRNQKYSTLPVSYAGRLDPMAKGKLLLLIGEECKRQKKYTNLDKEYEIEVLLDVGSDTGDALGLVTSAHKETPLTQDQLKAVLQDAEGTHRVPYPRFSSKTVNGKPLFLYALEGTEVTIPKHEERIYHVRLQKCVRITSAELVTRIENFLAKVPTSDELSKQLGADFRREAVRESWKALFKEAPERSFHVLSLRVRCGSGTYMRSLTGRIGEALGTRALALSIDRTKIGTYWKGWWIRQY